MKLDLAISPCPNDTFIFHGMKGESIGGHPLHLVFADVEELNRRAVEEQKHLITKISFFAFFQVQDHYEFLSCGGAIGDKKSGPLLISYEAQSPKKGFVAGKRIAIPGERTTANLLLHLFLKKTGCLLDSFDICPMRYDSVIPSVESGDVDFGVVIHEEGLTFLERGLTSVQDLGEWWQNLTNLPIPLGCIAIRKDIPEQIKKGVESKIRSSIQSARQNPAQAWPFVKEHSRSLDNSIIQQHINLYVNEFSLDLGEVGRKAIQELSLQASSLKDGF